MVDGRIETVTINFIKIRLTDVKRKFNLNL